MFELYIILIIEIRVFTNKKLFGDIRERRPFSIFTNFTLPINKMNITLSPTA